MRLAAMAQQRRVMELARARREEENPPLILKTKLYCSPKKNSLKSHTTEESYAEEPMKTPEKVGSVVPNDDINRNTPQTAPNTPANNDNNSSYVYNINEEEVSCTICMTEINDGDRIGALPCNHLFHSSCLKEWIKRRNVCPLCQEPNIATPQRSTNPNRGNSTSLMTGSDEIIQELDEPQNPSQFSILVDTLSGWRVRRPMALNTESEVQADSPTPPPPPRGDRRNLQRLTLGEDGEVQITPHSHTRRRREVRLARGRGLIFAANQRNRYRHDVRNRGSADHEVQESSVQEESV